MARCWIGLGGNQEAVAETFRRAVSLLDCAPGISVTRMSGHYTTTPVGAAAGPEFLNAAAELQTALSPLEMLSALQSVETQLGRVRTIHWGPRTLDLDLLLYDKQSLRTPTLTIPHPHMWYRRFVLDPFAEIAPEVIHCRHGLTIAELRQRLLTRPLKCALQGGAEDLRADILQKLIHGYPETAWQLTDPMSAWLQFNLEPAPPDDGIAQASRIDVATFPTSPEQAIRDVLAAALDPVRTL